jgi:hypothetical protein
MPMTPFYRKMRVNGEFSSKFIRTKSVAADYVASNSDSGTVFFLNQNGIDLTLPSAPVDGWHCKVIMAEDYATASCTVTINGSGEFFAGSVSTADNDAAADAAKFNGSTHDVIKFDANSLAGDWVEIICNGSAWFVNGNCVAVDAISAATS